MHEEQHRPSFLEYLRTVGKDQKGQTIVEYILIIALVALATVAFYKPLTDSISTAFTNIGTKLTTSTSPPAS